MAKNIFDYIVIAQDKTLTGSWKPLDLFILVFLVICLIMILNRFLFKDLELSNDRIMMFALQGGIIAVIINFITGKLFASRKKMYKTKGFSSQRAKAQAYANSRMAHVVSAMSVA